ncbi:MAG: MBL fold metallo-hydrolase [Planctomycetes bacterium]|nr:MBL fold metallo-hydrolase [Planctomycetota bacterium]
MKIATLLSLPLALAPLAPFALAAQKGGGDAPPQTPEEKQIVRIVQTETREIAKDLYAVRWPGGKLVTFFVGPESVLLIDNHILEEAPNIKKAIAQVTDKPVSHLINTHYHEDHTASNGEWGATATIIAHENAKLRMEGSEKIEGRHCKPPLTGDALPDVTFADEMELEFGGETIKLKHFAGGHSDGDIVVWFPERKVCVTGDIFYSHQFPFIDSAAGGSIFQLLDAAEALDKFLPKECTLIPGHGAPVDREALAEYRSMLDGTLMAVQKAIDDGFNTNGIIEKGYLDEWKERWDPTQGGAATRAYAFQLFSALKPQ